MQEILNHMISNGLNPGPTLVLDGKVHRFPTDDRKDRKNGWLCGFQNFSQSSGKPFHVVRYGDFKSGAVHQYQSDGADYTASDKKAMLAAIAKLKREAEAARRAEQERAAVEIAAKLEALSEGISDYHSAKGLKSSYGTKVQSNPFGGVDGYVPMYDVDGKLWNAQKIQANGGKFFYPGARVQGCFYAISKQIGEINTGETIYLAEGFATAASIHEATGKPVICAFNAGNLGEVARAFRKKYPEAAIVICGDEDLWTWIQNEKRNPGREAAEEAAKAILASLVFPQFKSVPDQIEGNKGPTDFNDLAMIEGIDTVRNQIEPVKVEKRYVTALGYDGADYFFLSNVNPQIQRLSAGQLNSAGLCRLQPLAYWESAYPATKGEGVSWTRAADELMQACHGIGIFRADRIRGSGVWGDDERIVYHRGTKLCYQGEDLPLHRNGLKSRYIYDYAEEMPPLHPCPLTVEECSDLLNACVSIRWRNKESYKFLAGWLAVAPIGGALHWRPHVWITGPSGSGKSYIMQEIVYPMIRNYCRYFRGQTTEAGIRQKCGSSTRPVLFDEFETNDEHSGQRIRNVLELARQASSDSDGIVAKGTVSGDAIEFRPQFSMIVGSVRLNLVHVEDENRFSVLELSPGTAGGNEQFDRLKKFVVKLQDDDYGDRLFSRMVSLAPMVRESAKVLQRVLAEKYNMRVGQQYGALLAGYWMLTHDRQVSDREAQDLCTGMDFSVARESVERLDEEECRDHLLSKRVQIEVRGERKWFSIAEAILSGKGLDNDSKEINGELQRMGVKVSPEGVGIAGNAHPELEGLVFRGTKWSRNWVGSLSRIVNTKKGFVWLAGKSVRGISMTWESLEIGRNS